jgi:hypothetical protein
MSGSFSYKTDLVFEKDLGNNTTVKIQRLGPDIARIYFVDSQTDVEVAIPLGYSLIDSLNMVQINPLQEAFFITWLSSYALNNAAGGHVLLILNQKQQSIKVGNGVGPIAHIVEGVDDMNLGNM